MATSCYWMIFDWLIDWLIIVYKYKHTEMQLILRGNTCLLSRFQKQVFMYKKSVVFIHIQNIHQTKSTKMWEHFSKWLLNIMIKLKECLPSSWVFWKHNRPRISFSAALDLLHSRVYESKGATEMKLSCCFLHSRWLFDHQEPLGSEIMLSCWDGAVEWR